MWLVKGYGMMVQYIYSIKKIAKMKVGNAESKLAWMSVV